MPYMMQQTDGTMVPARMVELRTPAPVPELVKVSGGRAVVVGGRVVDVVAYADPWGDGR